MSSTGQGSDGVISFRSEHSSFSPGMANEINKPFQIHRADAMGKRESDQVRLQAYSSGLPLPASSATMAYTPAVMPRQYPDIVNYPAQISSYAEHKSYAVENYPRINPNDLKFNCAKNMHAFNCAGEMYETNYLALKTRKTLVERPTRHDADWKDITPLTSREAVNRTQPSKARVVSILRNRAVSQTVASSSSVHGYAQQAGLQSLRASVYRRLEDSVRSHDVRSHENINNGSSQPSSPRLGATQLGATQSVYQRRVPDLAINSAATKGWRRGYSCPLCPKVFTSKHSTTAHIRTHTQKRPYACDFCDKRFSHKSNCKAHMMQIHTQQWRYRCKICVGKKGYWRKDRFLRHMKNVHGVRIP
mmetsp:Transcript_21194/g.42626  ORF Transcript_21194/g.42626 Transcript_21194/m.42626 type:complete len:361 (+) Transcript_21194:31-1113(+)